MVHVRYGRRSVPVVSVESAFQLHGENKFYSLKMETQNGESVLPLANYTSFKSPLRKVTRWDVTAKNSASKIHVKLESLPEAMRLARKADVHDLSLLGKL
jgi:hypothetical protein